MVTNFICKDCGLQDIVQYCADNHPEECRCTNPPCPATSDELNEQHKKMGTPKGLAEVIHDKTVSIERIMGNRVIKLPGLDSKMPFYDLLKDYKCPQPYLNGAGGGLVEIVSYSNDLLTGSYTFVSECSKHRSIELQMTKVSSEFFVNLQTKTELIKSFYYCPLCDKEVKAMKKFVVKLDNESQGRV